LPIRELKERNLPYEALVDTVGMIFHYDDPNDEQSVELQAMLNERPLKEMIQEVTGLEAQELIDEIAESVENYN